MGEGVQPTFFGKLDFELVVGPSGATYGQTFPSDFEVRDRRRGATPNMASENGHI